jgi:putative membrane protein
MNRFLVRILINAGALYLAVLILQPNIKMENTHWYVYLGLALIFGLVNALIKPILMIVSCPLIVLTLGLGTLLVNTALFLLVGNLGTILGIGFTIPSQPFYYAFLGALIVSVVSFILSLFFDRNPKKT